jgi:hypothetical protein
METSLLVNNILSNEEQGIIDIDAVSPEMEPIDKERDLADAGEGHARKDCTLYNSYDSFLHDFENRNVYYRADFNLYGIGSIYVGDLYSEQNVFVGATEIGEETFLHFLKLNMRNKGICISTQDFIKNKLDNKQQLTPHGVQIYLREAIVDIKEKYASLYKDYKSEAPR